MNFEKMSLREKVLQTFVVTIREVNRHGGPEKFFKDYPVGGMYYSYLAGSEGTVEDGTRTNRARLLECRRAADYPLLICADSARLDGQTVDLAAQAIGAVQSEEDAYTYGKTIGMQMNENQIDWVLFPIVDLLMSRNMPLFAFSDDPEITAKLCRAIIRGIQDQGVCATAKHFPGIGTCNINMHFGPGENLFSVEQWHQTYGHVYREVIAENVQSIMTTHMIFPAYQEKGENGYYPIATYSSKLTQRLLKQELGFEGAVVTDALVMGGMATGNLVEETVQAFRAGADLLLWPPVEAADRIVELLESGEIPMQRLEEALNRIQRMRHFREQALAKQSFEKPDVEFVNRASEEINARSICLLRNELGILPLKNAKEQKILIVDVTDEDRRGATELFEREFVRRGLHPTVVRDIYDEESTVCWQDDIDALQNQYDIVIFHVDMAYSTSWRPPYMLVWASHLFERQKKVIVNYGSPFFAETYFQTDSTCVEVNSGATEQTVRALVARLLGEEAFEGKRILHSKPLAHF